MLRDPLHVVICYDTAALNGGQAKVALESAIGLKRQGHHPIVFAAAGPVARELVEEDIETVCLGQHELESNPSKLAAVVQGSWNIEAARALDSLLTRLPPDSTVVHVHGWAKALSPSIAGPIARSGVPAVYTIHEYFQFCPNGGFYNYKQHHICRLEPLSAACWGSDCDARNYARKLWRNARLTAAKYLVHLPDVFSDYIAISGVQQEVVAPYLPPQARVHRIDNPVSVPDLGPKPDPLAGEPIFVGRVSREKGALVYAEAARRAGIVPVFVGDGPLVPELTGRYPEARVLGWHDAAGVQVAMRGARALVFPSLWYEGQPLTVLEAKALGLPVIVSDACAGREEVDDGVTGLWFRSNDPDDLARALRETRDDTRIAAMAKAAHAAFWADPPTRERHIERIVGLYGAMLERQRRPAGTAPTRVAMPVDA